MMPPPDAWVPPGCADLTNPDVFLDGPPHDTFARLRAEAPVAWHPEAEGGGFWCVTRWQDVRTVCGG
jgi:cytochrome P450